MQCNSFSSYKLGHPTIMPPLWAVKFNGGGGGAFRHSSSGILYTNNLLLAATCPVMPLLIHYCIPKCQLIIHVDYSLIHNTLPLILKFYFEFTVCAESNFHIKLYQSDEQQF